MKNIPRKCRNDNNNWLARTAFRIFAVKFPFLADRKQGHGRDPLKNDYDRQRQIEEFAENTAEKTAEKAAEETGKGRWKDHGRALTTAKSHGKDRGKGWRVSKT